MFGAFFNLLGGLLIILVMYMLFRDAGQWKGPSVALTAAAVSLFFGNLGRIDTFKAGIDGIEAKTKKAEAVVAEAQATVASLRDLAVATGAFQVYLLAAAGRIGGGDTAARNDAQKAQLLERLKNIGLSEKQLTEVDAADRPWVMWDYSLEILAPLNVSGSPQQLREYTNAFSKSGTPLTPDQCEELLNRYHIDDPRVRELLEDYRYYYQTGKQRRPDVWHARRG